MSPSTVINGRHQLPPCPDVKQFLTATPRGAYTSVWVRDGRLVVDWETHVARLIKSLLALHESLNAAYTKYYEWLEASGQNEVQALQALLLPSLRTCLAALSSCHEDLMLLVVLPPSATAPHGLDVCVHAAPYHAASASTGVAVILGKPREVPVGKDSGWVAQRRPLEQARPEGVDEVLLASQDGRLLEGLVTNLCVVTYSGASSEQRLQGSSSGPAPTAGSCWQGATLWTAGMGDGVVWGTVRARVLQACAQLGVAVREEAPAAADREQWQEAFLSNALRVVQPLRRIACDACNAWGHPPWSLDLPSAPGPLTQQIQAVVRRLMPATDVAEL